MIEKDKISQILDLLEEAYPEAECALHHQNVFQLIVAVALSAQTTDKSVNQVTPALFAQYPTPQALAEADPEDVAAYIKRIGMYKTKSKNIVAMAQKLCSDFGGEVPDDYDALISLPGVGRKTANVLGAVLWQKEVMPVDTHVFRVSNRIGLTTNSKTPLQTELTLEKNIPPHLLPVAHHWLILHGRYVCTARAPKCGECGIAVWCRKYAADHKAPKG